MPHTKKILAIAVAGALTTPAIVLAQSSTVQIGGSITAFYYQHKPNNPSLGQSGDIMETSEPNLYFQGEEKLGGGLSAWFKCESSLDGMIGGAAAVASSGWCSRNSGIGFKGGFGNIFMGNWDQPQKLVFNRARQWWGGTNAFTGGSAVLLNGGSASGATNAASTGAFFRRQSNSWNYHSPSWGGFTVLASVSAGNEQTGIAESNSLSPRMYGVAGQYASGPLYVGVGYEQHADYNPAGVGIANPAGGAAVVAGAAGSAYSGGDDTNLTVVVGYRFGAFNVRGLYSKSEYDVTNTSSLDVDGFGVFADWQIQGPHTLRAQYVTVGDTKGNAAINVGTRKGPLGMGCGTTSAISCAGSTGADLWALAYSYAFSKRTEGSVVYSRMSNDPNASYSKGRTAATAGNSQTNYGIVVKHRF